MNVYSLVTNGQPYSVSSDITIKGYLQRGAYVIPFGSSEIDSIEWKIDEPVVCGVGAAKAILKKLGVVYAPDTYPKELKGFLGREIRQTTLGDINIGKFIKPSEDSKKFTGFICDDKFDRRLGGMPSTLQVYECEVVKFLTEYRVYILDQKILSVARYFGSVDYYPDMKVVREMMSSFTSAPVAYSLDVAVTDDRETVLVEVNDALALGNYGLTATMAAKMHCSRWLQLVGLDNRDEKECEDSPTAVNQV